MSWRLSRVRNDKSTANEMDLRWLSIGEGRTETAAFGVGMPQTLPFP